MATRVGYIIITGYVAIAFRAVLMGMDKMTKVIIGNYLSGITCYAFGNLINQGVARLSNTPDAAFLGLSYSQYAKFLSAGQLTFVLILYVGLIRLIYSFGKIQASYNTNIASEKLYFIILIPITILSFLIGPYIALQADGIQAINEIKYSITQTFGFLGSFINHIPFWMFINGIVFIIISSHISFKISFSTKKTTLPEGL